MLIQDMLKQIDVLLDSAPIEIQAEIREQAQQELKKYFASKTTNDLLKDQSDTKDRIGEDANHQQEIKDIAIQVVADIINIGLVYILQRFKDD